MFASLITYIRVRAFIKSHDIFMCITFIQFQYRASDYYTRKKMQERSLLKRIAYHLLLLIRKFNVI